MALVDDSLKLEVVADLPGRPEGGGGRQKSPAWQRIREFVAGANGQWCKALEASPAPDKVEYTRRRFATELKQRLGAKYEVTTRVEGVVVQAFARLKTDAA